MVDLANFQDDNTSSFAWYEEIKMDQSLSQGDIIFDFPVPLIVENTETFPFFKAQAATFPVIVMTQSCDLEQNKVNNISLCAIEPLDILVRKLILDQEANKEANNGKLREELFDFSSFSGTKKEKVKKIISSIRQGNYIDFYLLNNNYAGRNQTEIDFFSHVVLLKQTYQLPIGSANRIIETLAASGQESRLRLLPPYREHLSQAYANTYSRIGLPIDINVNEIRDLTVGRFIEQSRL